MKNKSQFIDKLKNMFVKKILFLVFSVNLYELVVKIVKTISCQGTQPLMNGH
jgi:hypothetical protein